MSTSWTQKHNGFIPLYECVLINFYVNWFKSYSPNRQTHTHTHTHYENITACAGGNNFHNVAPKLQGMILQNPRDYHTDISDKTSQIMQTFRTCRIIDDVDLTPAHALLYLAITEYICKPKHENNMKYMAIYSNTYVAYSNINIADNYTKERVYKTNCAPQKGRCWIRHGRYRYQCCWDNNSKSIIRLQWRKVTEYVILYCY